MQSLEDILVVKLAVEVCSSSQLKKEILCVPGSKYHVNKTNEKELRMKVWNEIIEKEAGNLLNILGVPKRRQEKIIGTVPYVGFRMLTWATHYESAIGFSRNYSYNFFNSSFFKTRGIIDCKKAAEKLIGDKNLGIKQKYKVALYCLNEHIPELHNQITEENKQKFYGHSCLSTSGKAAFAMFWAHLNKEINEFERNTEVYWLKTAVKSGNRDVVEYCLEQTNSTRDEDSLIYAALEAFRNYENVIDDDIVFGNNFRNDVRTEEWVPNIFYTDIMWFLFLKMRQDTQIAFLEKAIKEDGSIVLEMFLDWPYQDYFLKTIRLVWDFLPEKSYVDIIIRFTCKIGCARNCKYGEDKTSDYMRLLLKFLNEIPEPNKRYIFRDYESVCNHRLTEIRNACGILIVRLFQLKNYTCQAEAIIDWLKTNSTDEEKNIISSVYGKQICIELIEAKRWSLLDEFVSNFYTSKEEIENLKIKLSLAVEVRHICIDFITNDEWNELKAFIEWSALPNEQINQLKRNVISSKYGRTACLELISSDRKLTAADKFIRWCFLTDEKASIFKKKLMFHPEAMHKCVHLVTEGEVEIANEFIKWSLSPDEDVMQYKKYVAYKVGRNVCRGLISDIIKEHNPSVDQFKGKWEKVERFLTWCFSSEDEINNFKKSLKIKDEDDIWNALIDMHLSLACAAKSEEAKILFSCLGLSVEEIRELKQKTILSTNCMMHIYRLISTTHSCNCLDNCEEHWEKINLFLRWFLTNEDDVLMFKNRFDEVHGFKFYSNSGTEIPNNFKNSLNKLYSLTETLI